MVRINGTDKGLLGVSVKKKKERKKLLQTLVFILKTTGPPESSICAFITLSRVTAECSRHYGVITHSLWHLK